MIACFSLRLHETIDRDFQTTDQQSYRGFPLLYLLRVFSYLLSVYLLITWLELSFNHFDVNSTHKSIFLLYIYISKDV